MTTFIYEEATGGEAIPIDTLQKEVESNWQGHQPFISKVLRGFMLDDWVVRFFPNRRNRVKGSGMIARPSKLIAIGSCSKDEMFTTLLHELLHYKHPSLSEEEIELRSVKWFDSLWGGK